MIKSYYEQHHDEPQAAYCVQLLREFIALTFELQDYIITSSGRYSAALRLLQEKDITRRLPELQGDTAVELLADLADLRAELEAQADMMAAK